MSKRKKKISLVIFNSYENGFGKEVKIISIDKDMNMLGDDGFRYTKDGKCVESQVTKLWDLTEEIVKA